MDVRRLAFEDPVTANGEVWTRAQADAYLRRELTAAAARAAHLYVSFQPEIRTLVIWDSPAPVPAHFVDARQIIIGADTSP